MGGGVVDDAEPEAWEKVLCMVSSRLLAQM